MYLHYSGITKEKSSIVGMKKMSIIQKTLHTISYNFIVIVVCTCMPGYGVNVIPGYM